jgi:hypothetical protein
MKTAVVFASAIFALACSGPAQPSEVPAPACTGSGSLTILFQGLESYDALAARDGFVYVEVPGAGVQRCPTSGCAAPSPVVATESFISAALATTVTYSTENTGTDGALAGEIRSVGADGTGDRSLLADASYPAYVAPSGARTFWARDSFAVDDTPASVQCVGCDDSGASTPWITGLGGSTYGMIADATDVYVLADDASLTSVSLLACSIDAPCLGEPRVVVGGLDRTVTAQQLATDGASVYVARAAQRDVVRVDASGVVTPIVTAQSVSALAFDASTGALYYGTADGAVARVSSDGSVTTLACGSTPVAAVAVDASSVYFVNGESASVVIKTAK